MEASTCTAKAYRQHLWMLLRCPLTSFVAAQLDGIASKTVHRLGGQADIDAELDHTAEGGTVRLSN